MTSYAATYTRLLSSETLLRATHSHLLRREVIHPDIPALRPSRLAPRPLEDEALLYNTLSNVLVHGVIADILKRYSLPTPLALVAGEVPLATARGYPLCDGVRRETREYHGVYGADSSAS